MTLAFFMTPLNDPLRTNGALKNKINEYYEEEFKKKNLKANKKFLICS